MSTLQHDSGPTQRLVSTTTGRGAGPPRVGATPTEKTKNTPTRNQLRRATSYHQRPTRIHKQENCRKACDRRQSGGDVAVHGTVGDRCSPYAIESASPAAGPPDDPLPAASSSVTAATSVVGVTRLTSPAGTCSTPCSNNSSRSHSFGPADITAVAQEDQHPFGLVDHRRQIHQSIYSSPVQ